MESKNKLHRYLKESDRTVGPPREPDLQKKGRRPNQLEVVGILDTSALNLEFKDSGGTPASGQQGRRT